MVLIYHFSSNYQRTFLAKWGAGQQPTNFFLCSAVEPLLYNTTGTMQSKVERLLVIVCKTLLGFETGALKTCDYAITDDPAPPHSDHSLVIIVIKCYKLLIFSTGNS